MLSTSRCASERVQSSADTAKCQKQIRAIQQLAGGTVALPPRMLGSSQPAAQKQPLSMLHIWRSTTTTF